jgi:uncharacterized membrane protein YgcG
MAVAKIDKSFNKGGKNAVVLEPVESTPPVDNTSLNSAKKIPIGEDTEVVIVPTEVDVVLQTSAIEVSEPENLIVNDGSQYDDDGLRMFNRAGIIERNKPNQPSDKTSDEISEIEDIRRAAEDLGLTGSEPIAVLDLTNPNVDFLIALYPTQVDKVLNENRILITGKKYYEKLKSDLENGNVYSYNLAFDDRFIVKLVIGEWIDLFNTMKVLEEEPMIGVTMFKNLFIEINENIDYVQLLNYIDWMVSKPDYTNFRDKGTIPSETFSDYWIKDRVLDFVPKTIEAEPEEPTIESVAVSGPSEPQLPTTNFLIPFGEPGTPGEIREFPPTGQLYIWNFNYNVGKWNIYNPPPPTTGGINDGSNIGNVGFDQSGGGGPVGGGNNLGGGPVTSGGGGPVGGGGGGGRLGQL